MTIFSVRFSTSTYRREKKRAMLGISSISLHISICTYRSLGTNCMAHCRWTDRMNGYDAIMQGRHGLRNMTQPSNTEYYRCIRLDDKREEKRRKEAGGEREKEKEREAKRGTSYIAHANRDLLISYENFCGYPYRSMCETISRCTPRAMKNTRFL